MTHEFNTEAMANHSLTEIRRAQASIAAAVEALTMSVGSGKDESSAGQVEANEPENDTDTHDEYGALHPYKAGSPIQKPGYTSRIVLTCV
jgi:hypothetical protein